MTEEEKNLAIMSKADNYNRWIFNNLKRYVGTRILEVGCGLGNMTKLFIDRELVIGTELNKQSIEKVRQTFKDRSNFKALDYDISKDFITLKKYNFDTVICINVLEHIKEDEKALSNMAEVLGDKGKLVLLVPAVEWLYGPVDEANHHHRRYSKKKLMKMLERCGYRIIKKRYMNLPGLFGWVYHNKILKIKVHKEGDLSFFNKLVPLFEFLENVVRPIVGLSLIMICEKNEKMKNDTQE